MEKLLNKFQKLHKKGKISNVELIAGGGLATLNAIKEALKTDDTRLAKLLIAEHEKNLNWMMKVNE